MKGVSNLAIALTLIGIVGVSSVAVYLSGVTQFGIKPEGDTCLVDSDCASEVCGSKGIRSVRAFYSTTGCAISDRFSNDLICPSTIAVGGVDFPVDYCIASVSPRPSFFCQETITLSPGGRYTCGSYTSISRATCTLTVYYDHKECVGVVCGDNTVQGNEECDPPGTEQTCGDNGIRTCLSTCQWSDCIECNDHNPCTVDQYDSINKACTHTPIASGSIGSGFDDDNCGGYYASCKNWECVNGECSQVPVSGDKPDCTGNKYCDNGNCAFKPNTCGNALCEEGEDANNCPSDCSSTCGNNIIEPGEQCDGDSDVYDISECYVGSCIGTKQIKKSCVSCSWIEEDISICEKDDLCCGITCEGRQTNCLSYCDLTNRWCVYSQSVATCTDQCVNGACIPCVPDCGTPNCQLILNKCGAECITPNEEVPCSLDVDNCGYKKCLTNGKYGSCYAKEVCIDTHECVDEAGIFTCKPKDVRVTHHLEDYYSVGENIIFTATIPYTPSNHPIQSDLIKDTTLLQSVECSNIGGAEWSCVFTPVINPGIYKVKTSLTHPSTGSLVTKEDDLIVRESLVVRFTAESLIQYVGQDIITKLEVQPGTIQVSKALSAKLCTGLCLVYNDIVIIPQYIPTGGNTWDVVIPSGQINQKGMLQLTMIVADIANQYEPVTKTQTLEIGELGLNVRIEAPVSVQIPSAGSKTEQIIVRTSLGTDPIDVDRLEMRVRYVGLEELFTLNDFTKLDTGKYSLTFTFTQSQNHYFKASAWKGTKSATSDVNIAVGGGIVCPLDVTRGVCDIGAEECDPDCIKGIDPTTIAIVGIIGGIIVIGSVVAWKKLP